MTLGYRFGLALYDKSQAHVQQEITIDDARKLLVQKSNDHWKRLGGSITQKEQLVKSLQSVDGPKFADFVQTCVSEGVDSLQGFYDYASSFFKIDVPFIIGGSAS
jgi:hypothetical protein